MHHLAIPALVLFAILAPTSRLLAFNREYFDLTLFEILLTATVSGLVLSIPMIVIASFRAARTAVHLMLSVVLITSVLTSFVLPVSLGAIDGGESVGLAVRSEALVALTLGLAVGLCIVASTQLWPSFAQRLSGAVGSLRTISILYVGLYFLYAAASGPISFGVSGEVELQPEAHISTEKNVFIISFDQIQGSFVHGYLQANPEKANLLDGFVFFPDAAATYPNTNYSLSSVLLGRVAKDSRENWRYAIESDESILAVAQSKGLSVRTNGYLANQKYRCITCGSKGQRFNFVQSYELLRHAINIGFGIDIASLGMKLSGAMSGPFPPGLVDHVWQIDLHKFQAFVEGMTIADADPTVYFMHFAGTHQPFIYREDCSLREREEIANFQTVVGAKENLSCLFSLLELFLKNLEKNGVYDQSLVIIFSDHGFERNININANDLRYQDFFGVGSAERGDSLNTKPVGSYNPMLFVKQAGSRGHLAIDDSPVSLIDIAPTVCDAIECGIGWPGISLFGERPTQREREFWLYRGGEDRRGPDGQDKLHSGLEHWERRSFQGAIYPALAMAMGASEDEVFRIYRSGETIDFSRGGSGSVYVAGGWSYPEAAHRWSSGNLAKVALRFREAPEEDLILRVDAFGYLKDGLSHQEVGVLVGGTEVARWHVGPRDWYEAEIPLQLVDQGQLDVTFSINDPLRPCDWSASNDCRELGLAVVKLMIISR
jgi:hypothetical protein